MKNNPVRLINRGVSLAMIAAISIATCATTALAQSKASDTDKETGAKKQPATSAKKPISPNLRAVNPKALPGKTMGPPAPSAVRRAPVKRPPNVPEPTITLKPGEVPKIEFDTPTYRFGRVRAGDDIVHDFWFTNKGNGPLEILLVKPGCGCTTAGEYDRIVQPGQTGKIPIKIKSTKISGSVSKSIRVFTNIPGSDPVSLTMAGDIWQAVEVTPRTAAFGRMTAEETEGKTLIKKVIVENNVGDTLNLTNLRSNNPAFRVESQVIEPGKKAEITVTLLTPLNKGNNYARIEADTGVAEMPSLTFAASAYVTAEVEVMPPAITLQGDLDTTTQRIVTLRNGGKTPIKVSDVKVSNPAITTELTETAPGKAFRVVVEIPAGTQLAAAGESISIKTDNPKFPELTVPIQQRSLPVKSLPIGAKLQPIAPPSISTGAARSPAANGSQSKAQSTTLSKEAAPAKTAPAGHK